MRIAALDDEACQLELIRHTMEGIGHECHGFTDGKTLLRELRQQSYDLLILDWSLPDVQGPAVVRWIRDELRSRLPILFVTNRREEADMVEGLSAGADDFMVKPIRVGELEARIRALLRRSYPAQHESEIVFGPYHFLPTSRTLQVNGEPAELKHREYELALFLFQNLGRLLSREHLREAVWGAGRRRTVALARHPHLAAAGQARSAALQRLPAVCHLRPGLSARGHRCRYAVVLAR